MKGPCSLLAFWKAPLLARAFGTSERQQGAKRLRPRVLYISDMDCSPQLYIVAVRLPSHKAVLYKDLSSSLSSLVDPFFHCSAFSHMHVYTYPCRMGVTCSTRYRLRVHEPDRFCCAPEELRRGGIHHHPIHPVARISP